MISNMGVKRTMLIDEAWASLDADHGLTLRAPGRAGADITLAGPHFTPTEFRLVHVPRPVGPSAVRAAVAQGRDIATLIVTPNASAAARDVASTLGASLLLLGDAMRRDDPLRGTLVDATGRRLTIDPAEAAPRHARPPGRIPWGHLNVAFSLLAAPSPNQRALAQRAGVTQPLVTQALRALAQHVRHLDGTWRAAATLPEWLVEHYPHRYELQTRWLTLDEPVPAARTLGAALTDAGIAHAFTGDVAADHLAPWANPVTTHVLTSAPLDLAPLGMTPAPEGANVLLSVTRDRFALRRTRTVGGQHVLEPWRVWVDLAQSGRTAASEHLRTALESGTVAP